MFLLVSVRHDVAHPDEHQHGVSIPISINLGKTFLRILVYEIFLWPGIWRGSLHIYLLSFPRFWTSSIERFWFLFWPILNDVNWKLPIKYPNLICDQEFFFFRCVSSASKQKGRRTTWSQVKPKHLCTLVKIAICHISSDICHTATTRCNCTSLILNNKKAPANDKSNDIGADLFQVVSYYYVCRRSRNGRGRLLRRLGEKHDGKDRGEVSPLFSFPSSPAHIFHAHPSSTLNEET